MATPSKSRSSFSKKSSEAPTSASLKSLFEKDPFEGAFLILSPDVTRRQRAEEAILNEFIKRAGSGSLKDALRETFHGSELKQNSLVALKDSAANLSLFAPVSAYRLRGIEDVKAQIADSLIEIISGELTKVALVCSGTSLPSNSKILKAFTKNNRALILTEPEKDEAISWLDKESARLKIKLTPEIKEALYSIAEAEHIISQSPKIDALRHLIERLSLACDEDPKMSDVEILFSKDSTASEFGLVDAIFAKKLGEAEVLTTQLFRQGSNAFLLLSLLSRSLTNGLLIKELQAQGLREDAIASALKMNPWVVKKTASAVQRLDTNHLLNAIQKIAQIDNRFKSASLEPRHLIGQVAMAMSR
jgi:DNA polymerase III delta subunit